MRITVRAVAKVIDRNPHYIRQLLSKRGIKMGIWKAETEELSDRYIDNLKRLIDFINEFKR